MELILIILGGLALVCIILLYYSIKSVIEAYKEYIEQLNNN